MTMQSYQQNLSWARSFSPVAENEQYPMPTSSPTRQQDQHHQPAHSQNSPGSSPASYNYYAQGGGVLAHEAPSFYPSPSYSSERTVNYSMAPPTSSISTPMSTTSSDGHFGFFQATPSSCNTTRSPPYCSTGSNNDSGSSSGSGGMHAFNPLLTASTGIARPTARKARAPYQRRQHTTNRNSNSTSNTSTSPAAPAAASYHCQHPGCAKSFTRPYNLTSHMRTHTSERPFPCSQCGRRFARQHDRNRHEKLHWNIKPHVCNNCSKPFARMDALNRHLKVENGCGSILDAAARPL